MLRPIRSKQDVGEVHYRGETLDDRFAEVATRASAFGGMFYDKDDNGILNVYLIDKGQKQIAEAAIAAVLGNDLVPWREIRVLQGQYSFLQLKRWHNDLEALFALPEVLMTDIDDENNKLTVGVVNLQAQGKVEAELSRLGIPREAVIIKEVEPARLTSTLQDYVRPLVGALQIVNDLQVLCTLGFNALRSGVNGFVTASHCTNNSNRVGGLDGAIFSQPTISNPLSANRVGIETVDPPLWTGGSCDPGLQCRASDSAFVKRDSGVSSSRGFIARTNSVNNPSDITIVGNWRIVYKSGAVAVNLLLNKVGKSSGWTQGGVTKVCVTYQIVTPNGTSTLLCQHQMEGVYGIGGDSGAPVFLIRNLPNQYDVWLYGLLWGVGWFSDIGRIQTDLGTMLVCASGFNC